MLKIWPVSSRRFEGPRVFQSNFMVVPRRNLRFSQQLVMTVCLPITNEEKLCEGCLTSSTELSVLSVLSCCRRRSGSTVCIVRSITGFIKGTDGFPQDSMNILRD